MAIDNRSKPTVATLPQPATLVELLSLRAHSQPDRSAYTFLADGDEQESRITYRQLDERAKAIGATLQAHAKCGERALLLYPSGLDYIAAFFGCLYAGIIAVPAYPPGLGRRGAKLSRLNSIASDCEASLVLCKSSSLPSLRSKSHEVQSLQSARWIATDDIRADLSAQWRKPEITEDTLAFLQYTSGSTAAPKGVMVSHENLLRNQRLIQDCFEQTERSVIVGWLPLYHDMGLIGNTLHSLYLGAPCILMSPTSFLQNPLRWLSAISRYKATTSGGPNFAYDLCVRRISPEQCESLNLSTWATAFNGAEPIRPDTIERFAEKFGPYGFSPKAFAPCYGLAEATLIVSGGAKTGSPVARTLQAAGLEQNRIISALDGSQGARKIMSCGRTVADHTIAIVDGETLTRRPADQVGEIWVSGPSVPTGYWNRAQESAETFQAYLADSGEGPFLRTGDLGFVSDGQLFVTGRAKDLIIIRGRNLYPQDIELTVERSHNALRQGCGAAFSLEIANQERLVIVQELEPRSHADLADVLGAIRQSVSEEHEVQAHAIALIKAGSLPKTSSGKVQRHACRAKFQSASLDVMAEYQAQVTPSDVELPSLVSPDDAESIEPWLAAQLAAKLCVEPSDIDTNSPLVRYGIDSITSIELAHSIERGLGVSIPLVNFLEGTSVAELAEQIRSQIAAYGSGGNVSADHVRSEAGPHPLSYDQRALWFLHQLAPESAAYNLASAVSIHADLNVAALRRAFQSLVNRHSCLRTTFTSTVEGMPVQLVHERADLCFEESDASALTEAEMQDRLTSEANRPFDLEQGPLLRVHLFKRSSEAYVMLLVIHHVVADLWSLAILVDELGAFYRAECDGVRASLAPLNFCYIDFVRQQMELLAGPRGLQLQDYWEKRLAGELPALNLPADRPRPPVQTYSGASSSFELSAEMTEALRAICKEHDATLFMGLLAIFQVLLHRYTGQEDLLIGCPTSGRSSAASAELVGYFVNPLVLRANLSGDLTFVQFLSQVRQTVLDAFQHQEYPLALLVERLQPERDPSRSPLFQAMFIYQKLGALPGQNMASFAFGQTGAQELLGGLSAETVNLPQRSAQLDITLRMAEVGAGLAAALDYNTDLFDAATIDRMAGHFENLLKSVVAAPRSRISELPILTRAEKQQTLVEWNDTASEHPRNLCFHELFEQQVERTPDAIAVVFEEQRLSYGELNARANHLANYLRSQGVGAESRVGIFIDRSINMLIGLLGTLKSGAGYVPLDPSYPQARLLLMAEDACLTLMLTEQRLMPLLAGFDANKVCLDTHWQEVAKCSRENPVSATTPDNLAYAIYTSGSTGKPKGVMITHRNVVNFCKAMDDRIGCAPPGKWLAVTSMSFDISVFELLWTVARGFQVIIQADHESSGDYSIAAQIKRHQISHLQCTPALARMLTLESESLNSLQKLEKLLLGGEALPLSLACELGRIVEGEIHNMYGPTETTIWSTTSRVGAFASRIHIGRPITNTEIYIVDKHLQPLPTGAHGELCIGGEGVVRGYFNLPDLSSQKFIPNPFGAVSGSRMYRTGDLARYLPDGNIEYLGRIDHQVKIRGFRIELGEVEVTLARHTAIQEAAAIVREDSNGEKRLVAYVILSDGQALDASELRSFLKEKLPEHMIPSLFVTLESLPLTPNGKIDRRALLASEQARLELERPYEAPRNAVEEVIAVICAEILDLEQVGINDDFFELGGHSLLAAQLISRLREMLKIELPLRTFFRTPTVAGIAAVIVADPQQQARAERIAELLMSVAQYSDDQVEAMLDE